MISDSWVKDSKNIFIYFTWDTWQFQSYFILDRHAPSSVVTLDLIDAHNPCISTLQPTAIFVPVDYHNPTLHL